MSGGGSGPGTIASTIPHSRGKRRWTLITVVMLVIAIVTVSTVLVTFETAVAGHVVCVGLQELGNVSAWYPYSFVAAPYGGSESGMLHVWSNYTLNGQYHNLTIANPTSVESGNVTLILATGGNWTIFSASNVTVSGGGGSNPCTSSMIALLGPPNGVVSETWGGAVVASGLRTDSGLPSSFNASFRCSVINESPDCAVSSTFALNFTHSEGEVNTCGETVPSVLDVTGRQLAVNIPFSRNGTIYSVPIGASMQNGMTGWFNYTFPANGGIWQYQSLTGVTSSTSGLVFSYSTCP